MTESPQIIEATLSWLKAKNVFLTLLHQGYQSGSTVLVAYDSRQIEIDKPADWPHTETRIRILFKDGGKLWNYFPVEVSGASADSLFIGTPTALYRLQRRSHFRVETPQGSKASFVHKGTPFTAISIQDISAGGMQLRSRSRLPLASDDIIAAIAISIPGGTSLINPKERGDLTIPVHQGRIARVGETENGHCYGVDFKYGQSEEELLLRYVRQRELELLRKGLGK
ncbi:MAG: PilZ domain-containing protein [Desulfobacteraceae bacterium]|nr:PilZ domain-containing protein [Desulfobacteraceae bacterium]